MTSADPSVSHNWLRCLFLSLGAGAWKAVSMEDVQHSIMNQQGGTFRFPAPSPLRWWGCNVGRGRGFIPLLLCLLCRATRASLAGWMPSEDDAPPIHTLRRVVVSFWSTEWNHFLFWGHEGCALIGRHYRRPLFFFFIPIPPTLVGKTC